MRKAKGSKEISSQLRKKAEKLLHGRLDEWELNTEGASALLHELRVHQLELEMQNEELQQAYQTLEETRNKYAELYQFAPVGYFTIDEKGLILDVNLTGAMMLGGQRNDFIKKRFYDFLVREDRDQFYLHLRKANASKQRQSSDLQLTKIHGGSFYAQIQSVFMAGPDDASSYYLTLISDITQRKQAQDALYEAKREAERSNAAKTRFLAAASHDLRQPLQTISLLIGVLEKTLKISDPNIKDVLANLSETMNDMGGLLNTLLDISRLEGGGVLPRLAELPIDKLFRRLETHFARLSMEKGIQLRLVPSRLVVQSDAALLERVLQNLLSNAIRHTEKGKILLGCRRRGAKLRIEVWDTGPGIPADQQSKIFEDYYQLENPARDRRKGLGLGLAIVERTTRLLNHPIEVRSTVGKGSVFAVEVPILHRHPTEDEPSPEQNSEALAVSMVTILLIEDEASVLESEKLLLQSSGYRVVTAMSADDAMAETSKDGRHIDLIISDYRLPECVNGVDLVRKIRRNTGVKIPALIITGDMSLEHSGGDCRILHKPIDADNLLAMISMMIRQRSRYAGDMENTHDE